VSVTKIPAQLEAALVREALLKKQVSKQIADHWQQRAWMADLWAELEDQKNERVHWQQRAWIAEDKVAKLQSKIDTAIEQLNEHIHEDKHHLDDILFDLEGGCDSFKLELHR